MKKIATIGWKLPSTEITQLPLITDVKYSLADYNIVLLELNVFREAKIEKVRKHVIQYIDDANLLLIQFSAKHWKEELSSFIQNGGMLIVNMCELDEYQNYYGTNVYKNYNHFLPTDIKFDSIIGHKINLKNQVLKDFLHSFEEKMSYKVFMSNLGQDDDDLLYNHTKDKIIGARECFEENEGHVLYLPQISIDASDTANIKRLIQCVIKLDDEYKGFEEKSTPPKWLSNSHEYSIASAELLKKEMKVNEEKIEKLTATNVNLREQVAEQESLRDLLFETGKPLEKAVTKALSLLGYIAEGYDDGTLELDQVITSPEGHKYIGECEGKDSKAIDITKFRQLNESLQAYLELEEVVEPALGLLIGNPYRLLDPNKRAEPFTSKCIIGAERQSIGLIATPDLFHICKYIQEHDDSEFAKKCREAIINQLGSIIKFPDIPNLN